MKSALCLFVTASFVGAILAGAHPARAATTTVIYSFAGNEDGEYADTDLVRDAAGNLYGTTVQGGTSASGTVWELSPSGGSWTHSVLYSFSGGTDGGEPYKGVTLDAQENIFGTAVTGGSGGCEGGCGVVYELANSGGKWSQTVVHAFSGGDDGSGPGAGLTIDSNGDVYGTTPTGGTYGQGTIFRLHRGSGGAWKLKVLHAFTGGSDGIGGSAGRLVLAGNHLYGTATSGGDNSQGTAFELTQGKHGNWRFKPTYEFTGQPDAGFPYGGLALDTSGNLYGTTYYGGASGMGSVYRLAHKAGVWSEKLLYSFKGGSDGGAPLGNLVLDPGGNLFGTTSGGGSAGAGVVFELVPPPGSKWTENVGHAFQGPPDGAYAYNGLVADGAGNYFGATTRGGAGDEGAIYEFTP
jgi:uncharacterized repeat protein (TIGR03803 family)